MRFVIRIANTLNHLALNMQLISFGTLSSMVAIVNNPLGLFMHSIGLVLQLDSSGCEQRRPTNEGC
jgi:hypothetical protein